MDNEQVDENVEELPGAEMSTYAVARKFFGLCKSGHVEGFVVLAKVRTQSGTIATMPMLAGDLTVGNLSEFHVYMTTLAQQYMQSAMRTESLG